MITQKPVNPPLTHSSLSGQSRLQSTSQICETCRQRGKQRQEEHHCDRTGSRSQDDGLVLTTTEPLEILYSTDGFPHTRVPSFSDQIIHGGGVHTVWFVLHWLLLICLVDLMRRETNFKEQGLNPTVYF